MKADPKIKAKEIPEAELRKLVAVSACPNCDGSGKSAEVDVCDNCKGKGTV